MERAKPDAFGFYMNHLVFF